MNKYIIKIKWPWGSHHSSASASNLGYQYCTDFACGVVRNLLVQCTQIALSIPRTIFMLSFFLNTCNPDLNRLGSPKMHITTNLGVFFLDFLNSDLLSRCLVNMWCSPSDVWRVKNGSIEGGEKVPKIEPEKTCSLWKGAVFLLHRHLMEEAPLNVVHPKCASRPCGNAS